MPSSEPRDAGLSSDAGQAAHASAPVQVSAAVQAEIEAAIDACWPEVRRTWSRSLQVARPRSDAQMMGLASIDMRTREVCFNGPSLHQRGLLHTLGTILSHELGHHTRYPGSVSRHLRMRVLERALLPTIDYDLGNLFTDLLINHELVPAHRPALIEIYDAYGEGRDWRHDPAFAFYLSIYEELWGLAPGTMLGADEAGFSEAFPGYRLEARQLGERLFVLGSNFYVQHVYFVSILTRYLDPREGYKAEHHDPFRCEKLGANPEDWAEVLEANEAERRALERALSEGWIERHQYDRYADESSFERRIESLPGFGQANAEIVPEAMAAFYRRSAERYLFTPPPQRRMGEATVPTTLRDWEPGEAISHADWPATLVDRGPVLGAMQPLLRESISDAEGLDLEYWQPRTEIYLDTSGSMPDPRLTHNAMTLAAQILCTATIRAGGWARILLYSTNFVRYWQWCRSETELSRFMMHYIGGGTRFPFETLAESVDECGDDQPIRVVISDGDFMYNLDSEAAHPQILSHASERSSHFIAMLHNEKSESADRLRKLGAKPLLVPDMNDLPGVARSLSLTLFPSGSQAGARP